ncbi:unnamed protein product [Cochlearia groenlandica]
MGFGVMKIILLLSLLLIIIMVYCCEARNPNIVIEPHGGEDDMEQVCEMCVKYVSVGIDYLEDDHNQDSLVESLHLTCSHIPSPPLKQQCLSMVDHYTHLLFTQLSLINSSQIICKSLNLCQSLMPLSSSSQANCDACRDTVSQVVTKLKDPETKLKIIHLLLKECKSLNNYQDKCKKMVFEYGPLMLTDLEKFLDKKDVCSIIGVCPPPHSHLSYLHALQALPDSLLFY